ncbi:hypothetical protein [Mycolicibacterium moriokaense]|uniref:Uncharacterized protein n=1 Tax=Mycolicibacterium moriokaense TaxID=39691 RepID=A0A318H0L8_9MYCO|nr:hypothetical protein [Mycolicibacterium moriokaense]PXW96294.1 hypothetical protein C8E89_15315 [Mycolicibacterium moriokaense]
MGVHSGGLQPSHLLKELPRKLIAVRAQRFPLQPAPIDRQPIATGKEARDPAGIHPFIGELIMRTLASPGRTPVSQYELQVFVADLCTWLSAGSGS